MSRQAMVDENARPRISQMVAVALNFVSRAVVSGRLPSVLSYASDSCGASADSVLLLIGSNNVGRQIHIVNAMERAGHAL